jgi:hypothetical protein
MGLELFNYTFGKKKYLTIIVIITNKDTENFNLLIFIVNSIFLRKSPVNLSTKDAAIPDKITPVKIAAPHLKIKSIVS